MLPNLWLVYLHPTHFIECMGNQSIPLRVSMVQMALNLQSFRVSLLRGQDHRPGLPGVGLRLTCMFSRLPGQGLTTETLAGFGLTMLLWLPQTLYSPALASQVLGLYNTGTFSSSVLIPPRGIITPKNSSVPLKDSKQTLQQPRPTQRSLAPRLDT